MEITFGDLWDRRWELHGAGRPAPGSLGHLRVPSSALFGAFNRVGGSSLGCGVLVLGTHPLLPPDFPPSLFAPPSLRSPRAAARPRHPRGSASAQQLGTSPFPQPGPQKLGNAPRGAAQEGAGLSPLPGSGGGTQKKPPINGMGTVGSVSSQQSREARRKAKAGMAASNPLG